MGASSFLEPPEGPFHPHPRQLSCAQGSGLFCCMGGKRRALAEEGAPGPRVMDTGPPGTCLTFSVEGLPLCTFKLEWERHDPRTKNPSPPRLEHSTWVLARCQKLTAYLPPLDLGAQGLGSCKGNDSIHLTRILSLDWSFPGNIY